MDGIVVMGCFTALNCIAFFCCYVLDDEGKSIAKSAMNHWMKHTCVKFIPRTAENDFVEYQFADA